MRTALKWPGELLSSRGSWMPTVTAMPGLVQHQPAAIISTLSAAMQAQCVQAPVLELPWSIGVHTATSCMSSRVLIPPKTTNSCSNGLHEHVRPCCIQLQPSWAHPLRKALPRQQAAAMSKAAAGGTSTVTLGQDLSSQGCISQKKVAAGMLPIEASPQQNLHASSQAACDATASAIAHGSWPGNSART